jgi:YVTN family beta-propeller protein
LTLIPRRSLLLASAAVLAGCRRRRGVAFDGYAFVSNEGARTVAAVDLAAFAVARQIYLDASPGPVLADPVRPAVYVLTPESGTIYEIGSDTLSRKRRAAVAQAAGSMRRTPDGRALWVLCRRPRQLVRLSLESFRPEAHIPLPADPVDFDLSPDGKWAGVSFGEAGAAGLVELERGSVSWIPCGKNLSLVRFRSDNRQLLVGDSGGQALTILRVPDGRVVVRLPLAVRPEHFCFNADLGQLFVTGAGMDAVVVVYPYQTEVAETALAGKSPGAMAEVSGPDGNYLFVANGPSGEVTVMDVETRRAIAVVAVGQEPGFITITPDKQYALVLNRRSGDMAVIRVAAITATRFKSSPLFTMIPVGSTPVSAVVRGL